LKLLLPSLGWHTLVSLLIPKQMDALFVMADDSWPGANCLSVQWWVPFIAS
jgi:hypothetical protein